jgi:hypothetical protein
MPAFKSGLEYCWAGATFLFQKLRKLSYQTSHLSLSPVNGTKLGKQMVENFSPNQTKFSVQRADPVSRYRFSLSARTQVGSGEAATEESPAPPNEGRSTVAVLGVKGPN